MIGEEMTAAIVLSTYNGEKYIEDQLNSLRAQLRPADKVYICDDGSTDSTVDIIRQFIIDKGIDNWHLEVNIENKGWKKNFRELILSTKEDIIFPCDQDDVWYDGKLSEMIEILENNSSISLLACGYDAKYEDNTRRVSKYISKSMKNSGALYKVKLDEKMMNVLRPGCAYAVRRSFCEKIESAWNDNLPHDAMLWRCAVLEGSAYIYDKNLFLWRRYHASSSKPGKNISKFKNRFCMMHDFYVHNVESHLLFVSCAKKLINNELLDIDKNATAILNRCEEFENNYLRALKSKNAFYVLAAGLKYHKCFLSINNIFISTAVVMLAK